MVDKITILGERLKKVVEGFEALKKNNVDEDLLITYICHKTKLSKKDVNTFLKSQKEFYDKLLSDAVLEDLEK